MNGENTEHRGSCYCGTVEVAVTGPPVVAGYCHCLSCRKWHSAPIIAWSTWPKENVRINGAIIASEKDPATRRIACRACGGCIANEKPQIDMIVVYPMTLCGSDFSFEPEMHLFYVERVMDFSDGLPKFVDVPESYGGSGELMSETGRTGWL